MAKSLVRALLDRPSSRSLGMLGLVVELTDGGLQVQGVRGPLRILATEELKSLVHCGDAQLVNGPEIDSQAECAALWVGTDFESKAENLGVPLPPLPKSSEIQNGAGQYWIGLTKHVWRVIDSWLAQAFRKSVIENSHDLASLMAWALPEREETRAALWHASDTAGRVRNLDWWCRLESSHGKRVAPRELEARFAKLVDQVKAESKPRVFGFCALAKGGDNEVAQKLSESLGVQRLSFGTWLVKKAKQEGKQPSRQLLQREGQEMLEKHGALGFCLDVLDALPVTVPVPKARFIIDGIRHTEVLNSLTNLVGKDHFTLIYIHRSVEERRRLLISEGVPENEVDAVMNHSTEKEVPMFCPRAVRDFDREKEGPDTIAMHLARA